MALPLRATGGLAGLLASGVGGRLLAPNCLRFYTGVSLQTIHDNDGARRDRIRVGRGPASRRGRTCGYGQKGQKTRSGSGIPIGFEGGQTPLYRRVPKSGFTNPTHLEYTPLNLDRLQEWIDLERIDPSKVISLHTLHASNVAGKVSTGVKLLGSNADKFHTPVTIEVNRASQAAIRRVEEVGGKIVCGYYNALALRLMLRPYRFSPPFPRRAAPPPRLMDYYLSYEAWYGDLWKQIEAERDGAREAYLEKHPEDRPKPSIPHPHPQVEAPAPSPTPSDGVTVAEPVAREAPLV